MKKISRLILRLALCAVCLPAIRASLLAGDAVPNPESLQSGSTAAAAQPAPSLQPAITPIPVPAWKPAVTGETSGSIPISSSAQIPPPNPPRIPFNSQNKTAAKRIYALLKQIQESEFDPEKNIAAITKLQDEVAQTDFAPIPALESYVKDSLTLNTLRSKDIKTQRTDTGKENRENGNKSGGNAGVGFLSINAGGTFEKSLSHKHEDQTTANVSISSSNDPAVLDKARQLQATSYGLLLNELKRLGFSRPVDAEKIYGRWRWRCNADSATYEFDFRTDGTVYVRLKADNPSGWAGHWFANKGRGEWKLDYRSLSLNLNDANLAGFLKQHPLIFFSNKEIVTIDEEKMLLACDEDNELKRITEDKR
jgi:hypothetical protein